jgi:transcription elongation factor Elf1
MLYNSEILRRKSMAWSEWGISLKCKNCGRNAHGYIKATRHDKRAIGCKECGLNTTIEIKELFLKIGNLEISVYIPYYC